MKLTYANNPATDFPEISVDDGDIDPSTATSVSEEIRRKSTSWYSRTRSGLKEPQMIDTVVFTTAIPGIPAGTRFTVRAMPFGAGQRSPALVFEPQLRTSTEPQTGKQATALELITEWMESVASNSSLTRAERCGMRFLLDELQGHSNGGEELIRSLVTAYVCMAQQYARQRKVGEAQYYGDSLRAIRRTLGSVPPGADSEDAEGFGHAVWLATLPSNGDATIRRR